MSGNPLLQVQGLTKRFGGLVAVKDIAFGIGPGEILGLIGPNGSGKSTVMKLIMGVERPNAGRVMLDGLDMAGWPTHRIARAGVGIVFQHSRPLNRQTVLENIKLALLPELAAETGCRPACGAPRAADRRASGIGGGHQPPPADFALRRSAPPGNGEGPGARSEGGPRR